jgi:hypothetical protein
VVREVLNGRSFEQKEPENPCGELEFDSCLISGGYASILYTPLRVGIPRPFVCMWVWPIHGSDLSHLLFLHSSPGDPLAPSGWALPLVETWSPTSMYLPRQQEAGVTEHIAAPLPLLRCYTPYQSRGAHHVLACGEAVSPNLHGKEAKARSDDSREGLCCEAGNPITARLIGRRSMKGRGQHQREVVEALAALAGGNRCRPSSGGLTQLVVRYWVSCHEREVPLWPERPRVSGSLSWSLQHWEKTSAQSLLARWTGFTD